MSLPQLNTPTSSSSHINLGRRRRQATACTSCRDRRVRCDRMRPVCLRCSKRGQICEYISIPSPCIEFVAETPGATDPIVPSETWKSVFESQRVLVDQANLGTRKEQAQIVPLWTLAESRTLKQSSQDGSARASLDAAISISSLGESFLSSVLSDLAPRERYLPYFENFLLTVHPLLPLYPITLLRQTYTEFWDNISLSTSAELFVLVLAILYTGAANIASSEDHEDSMIIHKIYEKLVIALNLPTYHVVSSSSSLQLLHGITIMNTFRASQLPPYTAFGFLPSAIRFAQSLRLHIHQTSDSSLDTEHRQRLWWHLVFMDVESTIASGLQSIIRPHGQTTQLPTLNKMFFSEGDDLPTPTAIAMQGHWELAHRMHVWLEKKPEQHEIIHFGRIIEQLLKRVPDGEGSEWARVYLRMLVDRAYCMLGLRFWQTDLFKGTSCQSEVVRTSRSFLERYVRIAELSTQVELSWFIPGLIQPIHALTILLMHLSNCSQSNDESKLSRDIINQVISLRVNRIQNGATAHIASNDNSSTIRLSNPRYRFLSSLRMQVWEKFGWAIDLESNIADSETKHSEGSGMIDMDFSQAELVLNLNLDNQFSWDDWDPITAGVFSEAPSWDDWGNLMPNFFTNEFDS